MSNVEMSNANMYEQDDFGAQEEIADDTMADISYQIDKLLFDMEYVTKALVYSIDDKNLLKIFIRGDEGDLLISQWRLSSDRKGLVFSDGYVPLTGGFTVEYHNDDFSASFLNINGKLYKVTNFTLDNSIVVENYEVFEPFLRALTARITMIFLDAAGLLRADEVKA